MTEDNDMLALLNGLEKSEQGKKVFDSFMDAIKTYGMLEKIKNGVLVGFSGGSDSVMLLSLLHLLRKNTPFDLAAVHINHMIRGEEAERDAAFSEKFAKALNIKFFLKKINVPEVAEEKKIGLEEAARIARYDEFNKILEENKEYSFIATAHNSTDNLETVIFNLVRGTGLSGVKGIVPIRDNILRPLILCSKKDICDALNESHVPYVNDSTNLSLEYSRNLIRNNILPEIRKISQNPEKAVSRFCSNITESFDYIDSIARDFVAKNNVDGKIPISSISSLNSAVLSRVIMLLSEKCGSSCEAVHINGIKGLIRKGSDFSVDIPGNLSFVCEGGFCFICHRIIRERSLNFKGPYKIEKGLTFIPELGIAVLLTEDENEVYSSNVYKFSIQVDISSAIIDNGLYIRTRTDGDAYCYGGMTHKVKRLLSDRKIPKAHRDNIPILCDGKGIVVVAGFPPRDDGGRKINPNLWLKIYKSSTAEN